MNLNFYPTHFLPLLEYNKFLSDPPHVKLANQKQIAKEYNTFLHKPNISKQTYYDICTDNVHEHLLEFLFRQYLHCLWTLDGRVGGARVCTKYRFCTIG